MRIRFSRKFTKLYEKAPVKNQRVFEKRLELFKEDPANQLLNNHQLKGDFRGYRSMNVSGDWRAIYREINADEVIFELLGTHGQLYG